MAFPTLIGNVFFGNQCTRAGPFLYGSAVYLVTAYAPAADTKGFRVHKSTTPDTASSFAEQDGTNRPSHSGTTAATVRTLEAVQSADGTTIFVAAIIEVDGNVWLDFAEFDCSTDSWVDQGSSVFMDNVLNIDVSTSLSYPDLSLTVRSTDEVVVHYTGATDKVMGSTYQRTDYARRTAPLTWTTGVSTDNNGGASVDYWNPICAKDPASNAVHLYFQSGSGTDGRVRTLSALNALGTVQVQTAADFEDHPLGGRAGICIDDTSDGFYVLGCKRVTATLYLSAARADVASSTVSWPGTNYFVDLADGSSSEPVARYEITAGKPYMDAAVDGTDVYIAFSGGPQALATDQDLYWTKSTDKLLSVDSPTELLDAINCLWVSCNVYTRSGSKVLAISYSRNDASPGIYYTEVSLSGGTVNAAGTITLTGDLAAIGSNIRLLGSGTITATGDLTAAGKSLAAGTSTLTGDLAAIGTGMVYGAGTITLIGDLAGVGTSLAYGTILVTASKTVSGGTHFAAATITLTSDVTANSGALRASGTITLPGDLAAAPGLLLAFAAGTSTLTGDLAAVGRNLAAGTSTLIGDLAAIGVSLGGVVTADGTSTLTGDLAGVGTSLAYGTILVTASKTVSGGTHFAQATITLTGDTAATAKQLAAGTATLTGDLAAATGTTFVYAAGTITMTGTATATGTTRAAGTITMTGTVTATAVHLSSATITYIGQLIAGGGASLGTGTIALAGDLAAVGDNIIKTPSGTITISATLGGIGVNVGSSYATLVPSSLASDTNSNIAAGTYTNIDETVDAADGTTLDSVTNQWTGSGTASAFVFNLTDVPSDFASAKTAYIRVRARVTGTVTAPQDESSMLAEVIGTNAPTSNVGYNEGDVGAGFINRAATSQSVSSASAANINAWQVRFYQTAFAQLGGANNLNFEIDAVEVVLEYQALTYAAGTITLSGDLAAVGYSEINAAGTITNTGTLAAAGTVLAAGTITLTGDLAAVGEGKVYAAGTSTLTGTVTAKGTTRSTGTITLIGDLAATGTTLAYGTILVTASKTVSGGTHFASATITCPATLAATAKSLAAGTITIPGDLAAIGENALSLVNAAGTITITGDLAANARNLAAGTVTLIGDLTAATGISTASGTITLTGTLIAGGGTQFAAGTATLAGNLTAFGVAFGGAPEGTITMTGALTASLSVVTAPASGTIAITGEGAASGTTCVTATITIFGAKDAVGTAKKFGAGTILLAGSLTADGFDLSQFKEAEGTITLPATLFAKLRKRCHGIDDAGTITMSGSLAAVGNDGGKILTGGSITISSALSAPAPTWFAIEIAGSAGSLFSSGNHDGANDSSVLQDIGAFTGLDLTGYMIWNVSDEALTKDPIISNTDDTVTVTLTGGIQNDWDTGELYEIYTPDVAAVSKRLAWGTINIEGALTEADFRKKSCINPTGQITILGAVLSAGFTDPNAKFATATITMSAALNIGGPQPAYGTITLLGDLTARPRNTLVGSMAAASLRSRFATFGPIGPGTIDGLKLYRIEKAYGSATIYNNGAGGFHTIGEGGGKREAQAQMSLAFGLTAFGTGDSLKIRTGSIVLPGDLAAKGRHTGVAGTILISGDASAGGGKQFASGTSTLTGDLAAVGFVDEVYTLTDRSFLDANLAPGTAEVRIRIGADGNFYWWTFGSEGTNQQWVQLGAAAEWIRPTTFANAKYVRAIVVTGSTPYLGTIGQWEQTNVDRDWGLKVVAGFAGGEKDCRLRIDLGDDAATVIEQGFFDLSVQLA